MRKSPSIVVPVIVFAVFASLMLAVAFLPRLALQSATAEARAAPLGAVGDPWTVLKWKDGRIADYDFTQVYEQAGSRHVYIPINFRGDQREAMATLLDVRQRFEVYWLAEKGRQVVWWFPDVVRANNWRTTMIFGIFVDDRIVEKR